VRLHLATDHAKISRAVTGEIQQSIDGQRRHRALHEVAGLAPERRFGFGVLMKQAAIDQRCQILAVRGGQFKTVLDRIG
jgi:hypothetical protein